MEVVKNAGILIAVICCVEHVPTCSKGSKAGVQCVAVNAFSGDIDFILPTGKLLITLNFSVSFS
jgi:hypothetical protein